MQIDEIKRHTHGKWGGILAHYGLDEKMLSGKHSACPVCRDGKDRFRLISEDDGWWICNQCGSGDGLELLTHVTGNNLKTVMEKLKPLTGSFNAAPPKRGPSTKDKKRFLMKNVEMWKTAVANHDTLGDYLESRGLRPEEYIGADIRLQYEMPFYDEAGTFKRKMPCMVSRISTGKGKLAAIHRTYMAKDGDHFRTMKKITKPSCEWRGGAVRLFSTKNEKRLIIAEGIETALSVRAHIMRVNSGKTIIPCWAAISAGNLEKIAIPDHIEHVIIAMDNDKTFTGQKFGFSLANRLTVHDKRKVTIAMPTKFGADFNDQLLETNYG